MHVSALRPSGPIVWANQAGLEQAASVIREGGLVGMPTETVYGLGCNALQGRAVARVFEAKARPRIDPLIVHVARVEQAWALTSEVSDHAKRLAEAFWPGPLTLVLAKAEHVPDLVTSGLPTVAVRVPGHPVARQLIERAGRPIAAPSANPFGAISPTTASHVASQLGDKVDVILDGGPSRTGVESTVVSVVDGQHRPTVLRLGGLPVEKIEAVIGPIARPTDQPDEQARTKGLASPGMMSRHYAPRTPLMLLNGTDEPTGLDISICGLLVLDESELNNAGWARVETLSPPRDLTEAAANLFAALHRLDEADLACIVARSVPEHGLGRAINDRLRRAAME